MIDSMFQAGTDAALDDEVRRPRSVVLKPAFSLKETTAAAFQGIGGGVAKSIAFGAELSGAFGQVAGAYPEMFGGQLSDQQHKEADAARAKLLKPGGGVDYSNEAGDIFRARAKDILPDAQTAHASAQVVAGLTDFATRAVGYTVTLGPLMPAAMGGDAGLEEADRLKQQGVDLETRTKAGAVAGVLNAAAVAIPLSGATAISRFAKGVAVGESTIVGQSLAEQHILRAAGYDKLADSFDPLDPVALAMGVVPGVLGARFGHAPAAKPAPRALHPEAGPDAAAFQAASDAARVDPARIGVLRAEMAKAETTVAERARLQKEIDNIHQATTEHGVEAAVKAEPDLVPAARVAQVVDALDRTRLTPDADLAGRDAHLSAVELAGDQMGRGDAVEVAQVLPAIDQPVRNWDTMRPGDEVTLYRGESAKNDAAGQWWTTDLEKAARYGEVQQVTLPAETIGQHAARGHNAADEFVFASKRPQELVTPLRSERPAQAAAALDQLRAARQPAEPAAPRSKAKAASIPEEGAGDGRKGAAKPQKPPAQPASANAEGVAPSAVSKAAEAAAALDPDMLVHLDGMDAPMRVGDLLAKVKEEAANDVRDGKLLEVAAACDLSS